MPNNCSLCAPESWKVDLLASFPTVVHKLSNSSRQVPPPAEQTQFWPSLAECSMNWTRIGRQFADLGQNRSLLARCWPISVNVWPTCVQGHFFGAIRFDALSGARPSSSEPDRPLHAHIHCHANIVTTSRVALQGVRVPKSLRNDSGPTSTSRPAEHLRNVARHRSGTRVVPIIRSCHIRSAWPDLGRFRPNFWRIRLPSANSWHR